MQHVYQQQNGSEEKQEVADEGVARNVERADECNGADDNGDDWKSAEDSPVQVR